MLSLSARTNNPVTLHYWFSISTRPDAMPEDGIDRNARTVKFKQVLTKNNIKFKSRKFNNLQAKIQKDPKLMITWNCSFELSREGFCRLFELYTWNSDDEIIATRILPAIHFDPDTEIMHGTSLTNPTHYLLGLFKRILPDYPVDENTYSEFEDHYKEQVHKLHPIEHIPFLSHEELDKRWLVQGCKYTEKQIKHFHDILDQYANDDYRKDMYANQSFIKRELYEEEKFARLINSRSDCFKVLTAPYTKTIEEEVYVNTFPNNFIKHHEPEWITQRIKGIFEDAGIVCETDYSSFESSFGIHMMRLEKYFFDYMLQQNPEVREIIDEAYSRPNRLISSMGITSEVSGTRMSGEMWTSLGNGFMNMCLVTFVAKKNAAHADFIVEGDDCLVGFDKEVSYDVVKKLGFKLKLELGTQINDLSFCGYKVRRDGKPIVDIERAFRGLCYSRRQEILDRKETRKFKFKEYIATLALSYYFRCQYTPFLNTLLYKIIKDCKVDIEHCRQYLDWWSFNQAMKNVSLENVQKPVYDEEFYHYLQYEFGISKNVYQRIVKEIHNMNYSDDIIVDLHILC